ncbi:RING finger protein 222 [Eublepharis macularius]|uniref:RING finger protein 222 n=1 Tax=Eublepharis macularius TaxID=481883 RepID=A0AA97KV62_EUBMA|nr:RING finger protein 222 [Eublepharis macularius]
MSEGKARKETPAAASAECPVCYETFQSPAVSRRVLSCGHIFCHDCLVKCFLASQADGRLQNGLICPICRFITLLCQKRTCWPSKPDPTSQSLELPLSPSLLPCGVPLGSANTLVVPGHYLMSLNGYSGRQSVCGCPNMDSMVFPHGLEREPNIFIISQCGMPLIEENYVPVARDSRVEVPGSVDSQSSLGMGCFRSPIILAIFLVSAVALLGAVLPWLLLVKKNE